MERGRNGWVTGRILVDGWRSGWVTGGISVVSVPQVVISVEGGRERCLEGWSAEQREGEADG